METQDRDGLLVLIGIHQLLTNVHQVVLEEAKGSNRFCHAVAHGLHHVEHQKDKQRSVGDGLR
jgi:hypothetical protein